VCINKNEELISYYKKASSLLKYSPNDGSFIWKEYRSGKAKKGSIAGSKDSHGYINIRISINKKQRILKAHRLAWFIVNGNLPNIINHKDHITGNNRISNLEDVTNQHNAWDQKIASNNISGFKGVCWHKRELKWRAKIKHNLKNIHIGYFDCPEEASKAYEAKAKELRGDRYRKLKKINKPRR
jgi:hypothetical protein